MSTTMLLKKVLHKLTQIIRNFWWGHLRDKRKMHHLKWEWSNIPKEKEGLGLKNLQDLNSALLAKLSWRFLHEHGILWVRIMKSKYLREGSFWVAKKTTTFSPTWEAMMDSRQDLKTGCLWMVGNGQSISNYKDPWIPTVPGNTPVSPRDGILENKKVKDLIDSTTGHWNPIALQQL